MTKSNKKHEYGIKHTMKMDGASSLDVFAATAAPVFAKVGEFVTTKVVPIVGIAGLSGAAGVALNACDNNPDNPEIEKKVCECPAGTEKLPGEADCCEGEDCECVTVPGTVVQGIPVTNREGLDAAAFGTMSDAVEEAFAGLADWGMEAEAQIAKNNISEIRIVPGPMMALPSVIQENGRNILTVQEDSSFGDIAGALYNFAVAHPELAMIIELNGVKMTFGEMLSGSRTSVYS